LSNETAIPVTPWGPTGFITYKRTYARKLRDVPGAQTEEFTQTVDRVLRACRTQLKVGFTSEEETEVRDMMLSLKGLVAGRFLWQLGTKTVDKLGLFSLQNCASVAVDDPIRPFTWAMDALMLGSGVGYNIQNKYINKLPKPKRVKITRLDTNDADFIVPDSREGWLSLLQKTLEAHYNTGTDFTYSTVCVRSKGALIKGFGGVASGPEELCWGIEQINTVLNRRAGKRVRSVDALDIMNIIGFVVVSGNVRRSAQLAIGDANDLEFLFAKRWDLGGIPNWRAMSNNSVAVDDINEVHPALWEGYKGNGEPYGFINLPLSRKVGRLGEEQYPDPDVVAYNPCCEQSLANYETCCLAEIVLPNITTEWELRKVTQYLYRIAKHSLSLPCHAVETEDIVHRHMRMGIGITGYMQATEEQRGWLSENYKQLRRFDVEYSAAHDWPVSIKLCTVKPSGCSRKDSIVVTTNGLFRLDELGDVNGSQWQTVPDNMFTESGQLITKFFVNGKVRTRKFTTTDGFEYESSLDHRYLVNNNWKIVSDLSVGDSLTATVGGYEKTTEPVLFTIVDSFKTNTQQILQPSHMSQDLAYFMGLYLADGSNHDKGIRISFNRKDNDQIVFLKSLIRSLFGLDSDVDNQGGFYVNSVQLNRWLLANGLRKDFCEKLTVPKIIRLSSKASIKAFIDGFWRGDGGQHNPVSWSLCSVSKPFIQELAVLARAVGYNVSIKNGGPGGYGAIDRWLILNRSNEGTRYHSKGLKSRFLPDGGWADPIVSIEDSECETFDIEVNATHRYTLNGAVSHNTLSLLPGVTPGVHPGYSMFFIRRIRIAANSELVTVCKKNGFPVEYQKNFDGTDDLNTVVVSFPSRYPEGTVVAKDLSALDQLEFIKRLQTEWSDNSVSCTIYYRLEELPAIQEWLRVNYNECVKTVSFLLHSGHGFAQAPYEEITEDQYNQMVSKVTPITGVNVAEDDLLDNFECATGACPVK
jgi:hypothetical protein